MGIEELTCLFNKTAAEKEAIHGLVAHHEVEVALTVFGFLVLKSVPFFGERAQSFSEEGPVFDEQRQLTVFGREEFTAGSDEIAHVHFTKEFVVFFAQHLFHEANLNRAGRVFEVGESETSVFTQGHETAANGETALEFLVEELFHTGQFFFSGDDGLLYRVARLKARGVGVDA